MSILDGVVNFLNRTKAELPVLAVAGGLLFGVGSAYLSNWQERCYPLQFSERSQIERDAEEKGERVSADTIYHASALDIPMKVFEANNLALLFPTDKDEHFAEELQNKYREKKFHYNLEGLAQEFDGVVSGLREELGRFYTVLPKLNSAHSELSDVWKHDSHAQYLPLPETYTYTTSDGKGHTTTHTGVRIALKHVWTDHEYNLDRMASLGALSRLKDAIGYQLEADAPFFVQRPSTVNSENIKAVTESRRQADSKSVVSDSEARNIASSWTANAKIPMQANAILKELDVMQQGNARLENIFSSAPANHKSRVYTPAAAFVSRGTLNSFAIGSIEGSGGRAPDGFDFYEQHIAGIDGTSDKVKSMIGIIEHSQQIVKTMNENLERLSEAPAITSREVKLAKETRRLAEDLLEENFENGIPIPSRRWYIPILFGLLGSLVGGAIGVGIDKGAEAYQASRERRF